MKFPAYSNYKDSGVAWLGQVPEGWKLFPARRVFGERRDPSMPGDEQLSATQRYGVIPQRIFMEAEDQKVVLALSGTGNFKHLRKDDFVISLRSFQGGIEWSGYDGCVSPAYTVLRAAMKIAPSYWAYALKCASYISALQAVTVGIRDGKNISYSQFGGLEVPFPGHFEQVEIAAFLDSETRKIDALIAEQEKLLGLLAEKRQATISRAVTRGLNPAAPMKDSGIPWLGEIPAHWVTKKLRNIATVVRGASPRPAGDPRFFAEDDGEGQVPWVTVAEITKDESMYLDSVSEYLTPLGAEQSQRFERGLVIFSNSGATLGVPKILEIDCCANDGVLAFRNLSSGVVGRFLYCFLLNTTVRLRTEMKQGGGQPNLNTDIVKNIGFAEPPMGEQLDIVDFIDGKCREFDALKGESERATSLLLERRSALIAAAVTGKIDVRELVTERGAA